MKKRSRVGLGLFAVVMVILIVSAVVLIFSDSISGLFGPPQVTLNESYSENPNSPGFDHSGFDELLKQHVDERGLIDYKALHEDPSELDAYIESLKNAPFDQLGRDGKLALLINAYNAFTLRLILDHYPVDSIKDIPGDKRWDAQRWQVGTHTWSLNQIEHEQVRPHFVEPRIHFALVCAAIGCPILRDEAYVAEQLEAQLADQTEYVHTHPRWFRYEPGSDKVHLTKLYDWYGGDFEQAAGSVLAYVAQYSPELKTAIDTGNPPEITWLDYDWSLNSRANANKIK